MTDMYWATSRDVRIISVPIMSKWDCYLFGNSPEHGGIIWNPEEGKVPNWFWRKMQYLILGNKWVKKK